MRKIILRSFSAIMALLLFSFQCAAYSSVKPESSVNIEDVDDSNTVETEIYSAFNSIEGLISEIESNNSISYLELEAKNSELITNVSSEAAIALQASSSGSNPPIISAFLWGCIFNIPGMIIVGLTTDFDNSQLTKSAWGCLLGSLVWGGGFFTFN